MRMLSRNDTKKLVLKFQFANVDSFNTIYSTKSINVKYWKRHFLCFVVVLLGQSPPPHSQLTQHPQYVTLSLSPLNVASIF